jgi:FlaG/FlaF family flagellin (archaellin)
MDLTTVYWIIAVALVVAICVMAAALVAFVTTSYETVQRIMTNRHARNQQGVLNAASVSVPRLHDASKS